MGRQLPVRTYPAARHVTVGVSAIDGFGPALDALVARDSAAEARVDLSLGTHPSPAPVIATIRAHPQPEHDDRQRHADADRAIDRVIAGTGAVSLDTRLHTTEADLFATPAQLSSALARFDTIVTSRLHGLVLGTVRVDRCRIGSSALLCVSSPWGLLVSGAKTATNTSANTG